MKHHGPDQMTITSGTGIGVALGAARGSALGDLAVGMAPELGLGAAFAMAGDAARKRRRRQASSIQRMGREGPDRRRG